MERISKYLSYSECTKSEYAIRKGIDNTPNEAQKAAMIHVALTIFDYIREKIGGALYASSFFRSPAVNIGIGGAKNSQHCKGEAIDMDADKFGHGTNKMIFFLIMHELVFDQCIAEFPDENGMPSWVHVSLVDEKVAGRKNRKEVLVARKDSNGDTKYLPYSHGDLGTN